jgi:hypothetical protein
MGESPRAIELTAIVCRQFHGQPLLESGGIRTELNTHVIDRSHSAADQLGFRVWSGLIVQATQGALLGIEGNVALHPAETEATYGKLVLAPGTGKKAALVFQPFRVNNERLLQFGLSEHHTRTLTLGIGITNWPPHVRIYAICSIISSCKFQGKMSR